MLRKTVVAVVAVMLAATLVCAVLAATGVIAFALWGAVQLAIVLAGFVFERTRYKPIDAAAPPGFEATAERFVDPGTGTPVQVWFNPATGERHYVAV